MITTIDNPNPVRQVLGDDAMADGRLTWAARGLFLHLAQLPNGTVISKETLSYNTASSKESVGFELTNLREFGYIVLEKQADGNFKAKLKQVKSVKAFKAASIPASAPKVEKEPLLLRAEKLMGRQTTTPLTFKERSAYINNRSAILATSDADWLAMEKFYAAPQSITFARRSLETLFNNWNSEIEKARAYSGRSVSARQPVSNPTVFKVGLREFTLANPPKISDFSSPGEYETYSSAFNSWKRSQCP